MSAYYNDKKQTEQLKSFLKPKGTPAQHPKDVKKSEGKNLPIRGQ